MVLDSSDGRFALGVEISNQATRLAMLWGIALRPWVLRTRWSMIDGQKAISYPWVVFARSNKHLSWPACTVRASEHEHYGFVHGSEAPTPNWFRSGKGSVDQLCHAGITVPSSNTTKLLSQSWWQRSM